MQCGDTPNMPVSLLLSVVALGVTSVREQEMGKRV
jgi:hypothetical protein